MSPVVARLEHARALGYCARGMRRWFVTQDYSWADFVEQGVPTNWLRGTGDAMAIRLAEQAEATEKAQTP